MVRLKFFQPATRLDLGTIQKRAASGIASLTFRRFALQAISFISINVILARTVEPAVLGIFNIGVAIIAFGSFFADIGLAAAIIQKKEDVTHEDLKTTFTIQQILVGTITLVIFLSAGKIAQYYGLDITGLWLIRALAVAFFLSSLKVIPAVLLERELRFNPLVTVEIIETIIFNLLLLALAFSGFAITAFTVAAVARATAGTILLYTIAPWKVGVGISKVAASSLLSFGIPYQANTLLALVKDRIVPLFVAKVVGPTGLGFVTWSQAIAFLPLEVVNIVVRVSFPAISRLQHDPTATKLAVEKALFVTTLLLYPALAGVVALAAPFITHVVSDKWFPALPSLYLFSLAPFWAAISTTLTNALAAIGKIKITLYLMIMWTILTWILTPIFVISFGFIGVAVTQAIISFTAIVTVVVAKHFIEISVIKTIYKPLSAAAIMGVAIFFLANYAVFNLVTFLLMIPAGAAIYFLLIFILAKEELLTLTKRSFDENN